MNPSKAASQSTSASRGLRQTMRNHPLLFFFLLSFAFSWIISTPAVLSAWGLLGGDYTIGLMLKQWVGPALAAYIMTSVIEGKSGLQSMPTRIRQWHVGWQWYLFILLGVPVLILLGILIQPGTLARFQGLPSQFLVTYLLSFVAVFIGVGLPEEIGWRGFALPRMQPRYGPLLGTLLLGAVWGFWHLLYFLTPDHGGGPGTDFAAVFTNFLVFFLMVIALAIVFTWVFNHTRESVLIAALLHAAIDTPQLVWAPSFLDVGTSSSTAGETGYILAILIPFGVLALLIVILTRGRLGYDPNKNGSVGVEQASAQSVP
jgi:membrane protease YdiL (CAAX protease family)